MKPKIFICCHCGGEFPMEQRTTFQDEDFCPDCLSDLTRVCSDCGTRFWTDNDMGYDGHPLCSHCYNQHYTTCDCCGSTISLSNAYYEDDDEDQEYPLCLTCFRRRSNGKVIHDYHYRPDPIFYGEGPRWFGVELEMDGAGESHYNAEILLSAVNTDGEELLYFKRDGSLNEGLEAVTHPMSLDFHMHDMPWQRLLEEAKRLGYCSHQTNTCGLHVHVSRDAFGETSAEQDAVIARILYFIEKHWAELLRFSRRTPRSLERWAARYGYKDQPKDILDHAKKGPSGRYACLNLTNEDTIEFRIFRGTLKLNTLLATLQLVDRVCNVALCMSDDELKSMSWSTFVTGCDQQEALVQYLKERRLYVNEPIEAEAEV